MLGEQTVSASLEMLLKISKHLFMLSVAEEKALSAFGSLLSLSFAPSMHILACFMTSYEVTFLQILIKEATCPPGRCGTSFSISANPAKSLTD